MPKLLLHYRKLLVNGNVIFMLQMDGKFTQILFLMEIKLLVKNIWFELKVKIHFIRHYLARLYRSTLCYSKSEEMLKYFIKLLIRYLKFRDVLTPYSNNINYF